MLRPIVRALEVFREGGKTLRNAAVVGICGKSRHPAPGAAVPGQRVFRVPRLHTRRPPGEKRRHRHGGLVERGDGVREHLPVVGEALQVRGHGRRPVWGDVIPAQGIDDDEDDSLWGPVASTASDEPDRDDEKQQGPDRASNMSFHARQCG